MALHGGDRKSKGHYVLLKLEDLGVKPKQSTRWQKVAQTEKADREAYMLLLLSNSQSELTPIEIGWHALHGVTLGDGGRGKTGGIKAYAEAIGRSQQYITQVRQAAEVLQETYQHKATSQLVSFSDKAQHLAAIHAVKDQTPIAGGRNAGQGKRL